MNIINTGFRCWLEGIFFFPLFLMTGPIVFRTLLTTFTLLTMNAAEISCARGTFCGQLACSRVRYTSAIQIDRSSTSSGNKSRPAVCECPQRNKTGKGKSRQGGERERLMDFSGFVSPRAAFACALLRGTSTRYYVTRECLNTKHVKLRVRTLCSQAFRPHPRSI